MKTSLWPTRNLAGRKRRLVTALASAAIAMAAWSAPAALSAPAAHASPSPAAQQLVFYDNLGTAYSIKVFGYNQNGFYQNGVCFNTPGHTTVTWNWWWLSVNGNNPQVFVYHNSGCPQGTAFEQLFITPDGATPYRCLIDNSPYSDWSCPNP
jgi:hypothetical protein